MGGPGFVVRAEEQPAWAEIVRWAGRGESVPVLARGAHVADIVPSGELDRPRETIEVLSDTELVRDLREGLADARAGRCSPPRKPPLTWPRRRNRGLGVHLCALTADTPYCRLMPGGWPGCDAMSAVRYLWVSTSWRRCGAR
jgi:antitoxin (DNA-binding transcriptional repressor) of toxin-antitoxin stability system